MGSVRAGRALRVLGLGSSSELNEETLDSLKQRSGLMSLVSKAPCGYFMEHSFGVERV